MKTRSAIVLILGLSYLVTPLLSADKVMCENACCAPNEMTCPMDSNEESCPTLEADMPLDSAPALPVQKYNTTVDLAQSVAGQLISFNLKQTQPTPQEYSYPLLLRSLSSPLLI